MTHEESTFAFGLLMAECDRRNAERRRAKRELWSMASETAAENLKAVANDKA